MTRAGWSSGIGKSADAAFMAPAANDNAWPQHKEDTAAGNGVGDHQPGFKKTPGQTPFVFGSAGLAQVQPQATSPAARTPLPAANRRATLRRAPIKASPAVTPFTAYATPAAQAQTPLGGSPMDWSPMDVSPGPLAGVEEASRQRSWAAADQEPTPAFKPSRPLWEAADEVRNLKPKAADAGPPAKQASPTKTPDLETAFRQSLHVGPQPPQKASEPLQQAGELNFKPRTQGAKSQEDIARVTAELNKLRFPKPAAAQISQADGLEKTFEASLQFLSKSDPLPFQPGSAEPTKRNASHDSAGPGLCSGIAPRPAPIDLSSNAAQSDLPPAAKAEPSERSDQVKLDKGSLKGRTAHMRKGKHTPAKAQAAAQGCVGGAVSSAQGATNTDLPSTAAAGSTDNGAHKPPACFAQKAASLHPAGGTPGTADGDILQQLMRDMYSSDESWEPMHAGDRAAQNGAASRATSEPASMSTSHCSDTESSSSDEATENRAQAQPAAAAAAAHPDMPGFKAGVSFPTTQPAGAANEKQPPVFAFSQVPNKIGNLFTAGMQPGSQTKPAQKNRVQVNGIGNMDTGDHRQPDQNGAPLHPRAFISQRKQPKRRSPSRNVPPMQNGGGLHFWQVPDQANSGAIPQRHQGTGRVASGTQLNAKQDAVPGSPSELKRVDAEKDRGNAAFSSGLHAEAVRHYQMALSMLSRAGGDPVREAKLHGNLSATKLARGQPFEALDHCSIALKADATFTRGQIRAADAHSRLGNFSAAIGHLASAQDQPLAQTKLERVLHLQRRSAEAHAAAEAVSTVADGNAALKLLEAMLQPEECPWCPRLAACSCNLLLRCSQPANAVRLAERYARPSATCPDAQSWPPWVHAQAAFFAGELSKACTLMQAGQWTSQPAEGLLEQRLPSLAEVQTALSSLQRLMQLKQAGNDAVKAGKFPQAVAQYTAALVACAEAGSPAYAAVLHSNRAAALQSQSLHAEAMADCLRSRSLDPRFTKAHTRLATLLADVSLFDQAAASLEDAHASMAAGATYQETLEVQRRQREYRALTQRRRAPDHAKLMGLSTKASPDEIKKAYKKLALKFHPDKALSHCRFAAQLSPSGARLLSASEVEGRIRDSADWLFKHINEAQSKLIEAAEQKQAAAKVAAARAASYSHRGFSAYGPSWGHVESDSDNSDDGFTDAHFY
ncbi:hypothetical protein WJX84_011414 [Apatococcus fuscideae]|uniref:J domain-containing protein n=1 Tax=Apatococcus fuscideae TaxID=2026836 RepID=A0AAW1T904_9CHLO